MECVGELRQASGGGEKGLCETLTYQARVKEEVT